MKCYINSIIVIVVLLAVIKWFHAHPIDFCTCENGSNPWDDIEKQTYRKRTQIILGIEIISFAVL